MPEQLDIGAVWRADVAEARRIDRRGSEECRILARKADRADADAYQRCDEALVGASRKRHAHDVDVFGARDAAPAHKSRLDSKGLLKHRDFVAATMHDQQRRRAAIPCARDVMRERRIALRSSAD